MAGCYDDDDTISIAVDITYNEADGTSQLNLICAGKNYNPFNVDDDDENFEANLSVIILKKSAKEYSYVYDEGLNKLTLKL